MAFPDELLVEGEQVVVHKHPHWKKIILPVLALLLVATLGVTGSGPLAPQPLSAPQQTASTLSR